MPTSMNDLPADDPERLAMARPWPRRAWERVPGWAKIALGALAGLFVVYVALAIRVWYGLQDPPEVAALRGPGRHIIIRGGNRNLRNPLDWLEAIPIGLRGVSANDVTSVRLDEQSTDELVAYIASNFPNVQALYFSDGKITSQGLLALKNCPRVYFLDVSDTDVDDGLAELLPHLPALTTLFAMNTNLGDGFARAAAKHPMLEYCPIEGTDITPEAVATWKSARPGTRIQTNFDRVIMHGVIRWSDRSTSRHFGGQYELGRYGPQLSDGTGTWSRSSIEASRGLHGDRLQWSPQEFENERNGNYQFRLKLGKFESTPVDFTIKDGKPSTSRVEFQMPVTREEAERDANPKPSL